MAKYRFSSLRADGAIVSTCVMEAKSDDEARGIADEILIESQSDLVEVWCVFRMVHRVVKHASHTVPVTSPGEAAHVVQLHPHRRH